MSQFLSHSGDYTSPSSPGIDFDDAVKLPGGGSTCDLYRTRWQRREVFVKRLKKEYRSKPLYLDALDKEFDIGVTLRHPSLPEYREFHRDYIVMDYIDGVTLADMMRDNDPWLADERHIIRLLRELVDVVDYLHRHNVVHCDIKPDNIMITANNSNLVLIDFDKCYTDALGDTSGNPAKYGLPHDAKGRVAIDFHGIAKVVEKLRENVPGFRFRRYRKFVDACYSPDVNCERLRDILEPSPSKSRAKSAAIASGLLIAGGLIIIGMIVLAFHFFNDSTPDNTVTASRSDAETAIATPSQEVENTGTHDIPAGTVPAVTMPEGKASEEPVARTQEEIHDDAKKKAAILDKRITPYFNELNAGLDRLNRLKKDTTLSGQQLLDNIRRHCDKEDEYISEAFAILRETFPGTDDREAWRIMTYSKAYAGYKRRATTEQAQYRREFERRFQKEGKRPQ